MTRYDKYGEPLDGPTAFGADHTCTATEYGRCACTCHDHDDCGCDCCLADCDTCDHCEAAIANGHGHYPFGEQHDRVCAACNEKVLAEGKHESVSDVEIEAALVAVCDANRRFLTDGTFSIPLALKAIKEGRVEGDDNEGLIKSWAGVMAFGAFMSAGDWWLPNNLNNTEENQ